MTRVTYQYTVLRYMPDFMSGESLNVGIVAYSPKDKRLVVRTSSSLKRVLSAFPHVSVSLVHFVVSAIEAGLRSYFEANPDQLLDVALREVMLDDSAAMQHSSVGVGAGVSLEQAADDLLRRFVTQWEEPVYFDAPLIVAHSVWTSWLGHTWKHSVRKSARQPWITEAPVATSTNDPEYYVGDYPQLLAAGH